MVESEELELVKKNMYYSPLQATILKLLNENVAMTRDDLCRELGYGKHIVEYVICYPDTRQPKIRRHIYREQYDRRSTVYDNLVKLQRRGVVEKFSYNSGQQGRPLIFWQLRDEVVP